MENAPLTRPVPTRGIELLKLYGSLFLLSFLLIPFVELPGMGLVLLTLLLWFLVLMLGRQPRVRRWVGFALVVILLAALAPFVYSQWGAGSCPCCLEEAWGFMALTNEVFGPWVLWAVEVAAFALALLLPAPRWRWMNGRREEAELSLLPLLFLGFILVWPMLFVSLMLWLY